MSQLVATSGQATPDDRPVIHHTILPAATPVVASKAARARGAVGAVIPAAPAVIVIKAARGGDSTGKAGAIAAASGCAGGKEGVQVVQQRGGIIPATSPAALAHRQPLVATRTTIVAAEAAGHRAGAAAAHGAVVAVVRAAGVVRAEAVGLQHRGLNAALLEHLLTRARVAKDGRLLARRGGRVGVRRVRVHGLGARLQLQARPAAILVHRRGRSAALHRHRAGCQLQARPLVRARSDHRGLARGRGRSGRWSRCCRLGLLHGPGRLGGAGLGRGCSRGRGGGCRRGGAGGGATQSQALHGLARHALRKVVLDGRWRDRGLNHRLGGRRCGRCLLG
mmetsp:Transcript_33336/g.84475  ORF Transcript_33336/g.84475 Transcript_33336/m.84475 type:complete len:336 (+) Transcript_33336:340-1347(+)